MNTQILSRKVFKKLIFSLAIVFTYSIISFAQKAQLEFFPSGEYLSSPSPSIIKQDQEGFLWIFGLGVDRYDGYNFINIQESAPLWDNYFLAGQNYFSKEDQLVSKIEDYFLLRQLKTGKVDSIYFKDQLLEGEIPNEKYFHQSPSGESYFIFFNASSLELVFLTEFEGKLIRKFSIKEIGGANEKGTRILESDSHGNFYYLNKDVTGVIKVNSEGVFLQKIDLPNPNVFLSNFKLTPQNSLYFKCSDRLYFLKENENHFESHPVNQIIATDEPDLAINDFLELPNGDLWVCGSDRRLFYFNIKTGKAQNYRDELLKLIPHQVYLGSILIDKAGVIWVNSLLGIIKVVPQKSFFDNYFSDPVCGGFCSFRGMTEDDDGNIFASHYNSMIKINPKIKTTKKAFKNYIGTPFGLGYKDGHLLLNSGLRIDIATGKLDRSMPLLLGYSYDSGLLAIDNLNNWWLIINQCFFSLDSQGDTPQWEKKFRIPGDEFVCNSFHFGEHSQQLLTCEKNNLYHYNIQNSRLNLSLKLPVGDNIYSIFEAQNGIIWLGTDHGLVKVNQNYQVEKRYTTKDGLSHDFVSGILSEGDSCLWLGTNYGLSRLNIETVSFTNFYTEDGLSHNEFNRISYYKAKSGQMFFGGMGGVNAFYPEEVMEKYRHNERSAKVMLSSITKTDEKLDTVTTLYSNLNNSTLEFFHWNKSISLEFFLTDFKNSKKHQFSYLLEGYDEVWSPLSKINFAKYNSLPAGDYTFRVKAFDGKGSWNPNKLAIKVKVYPPWWKTTWAYLVYGLFFCGTLYGSYHILLYRMVLKNRIQREQEEANRLKELDSFKSRLFTNLTHEFRTPLTVILGMAKQVSKGMQGLKIDKNAKTTLLDQTNLIEKNGKGLLRLVNQLLDLSKLENNAFALNLKNEDVLPFLAYSVSSFQSYANQQNLVIKFTSNLSRLDMDFDTHNLQQVLTNLISNAIKFTPSNGQIFVSARQIKKASQCFLQIEIRDTGIGISAKKLPHVFDRFYQVDGSTTRQGEGTGIGLAHSKELVNLMDGEILVESVLGEGTTFLINIPIKNELKKLKSFEPKITSENQMIPPNFILEGKRIDKVADKHLNVNSDLPKLLLIEDNPDVVIYLKTCLEKSYEIDVAFNGKIGIEKAVQYIPELIISDVMMPEKDGYEVCDFLKNNEKTSHIPIVLLTAKADITSKIDGLKRGADAYLAKPFLQEELEVRLQMLLEKQQRLVNYFSNPNPFKNETLPDESIQIENVFIQKINKILEANFEDPKFSLTLLCQKIRMSRSQLFRKIKALTGTSPSNYIRSYRLKKAKTLLETTDLNVSEVAWQSGFSSVPHFSRVFQEEFGMAPSATSK